MPEANILIVGGGPAGLSTAGALKQAGLDSTILDRGERIGQSWEERYERLHLHTVRAYSGLAHFPIPGAYPQYLSKDQYAAYLRQYAAHFDLNVIPRTLVKRSRQVIVAGRSRWAVLRGFTSNGVIFQDNGEEPFDAVIMATGFHTGLEQLLEPEGLVDKNGIPRFPSGAPTSCTGLYFMGYYDSLRGFLYESNLASRRLAQGIKAISPLSPASLLISSTKFDK